MNKANLTLLFFCTILPFTLWAQDNLKAQMVLFDAYKKYKAYKNVQIDFISTTDHKAQHSELNGTGYVQGLHYVIDYPDRKVISDGKSIWTYMPVQNKVFIRTYDPDDSALTPDKIFREDFMTRGLLYKYIENNPEDIDITTDAEPADIVELIPKDRRKDYFKFRIYIDRSTQLMNKWVVFMKSGGKVTYNLKITPNVTIEPGIFTFDATQYGNSLKVVDFRK